MYSFSLSFSRLPTQHSRRAQDKAAARAASRPGVRVAVNVNGGPPRRTVQDPSSRFRTRGRTLRRCRHGCDCIYLIDSPKSELSYCFIRMKSESASRIAAAAGANRWQRLRGPYRRWIMTWILAGTASSESSEADQASSHWQAAVERSGPAVISPAQAPSHPRFPRHTRGRAWRRPRCVPLEDSEKVARRCPQSDARVRHDAAAARPRRTLAESAAAAARAAPRRPHRIARRPHRIARRPHRPASKSQSRAARAVVSAEAVICCI